MRLSPRVTDGACNVGCRQYSPPCRNLRAKVTVDGMPAFRYIAALSDFTYGEEALAMSDRELSGEGKKSSQCEHKRLLEHVSNREGKNDIMKCCECGAVVHQSAQKISRQ